MYMLWKCLLSRMQHACSVVWLTWCHCSGGGGGGLHDCSCPAGSHRGTGGQRGGLYAKPAAHAPLLPVTRILLHLVLWQLVKRGHQRRLHAMRGRAHAAAGCEPCACMCTYGARNASFAGGGELGRPAHLAGDEGRRQDVGALRAGHLHQDWVRSDKAPHAAH